MNCSAVTPVQSLLWKNSLFVLPKKPSQTELSGLQSLADMLPATRFSRQISIQPGRRWCPPRSELIRVLAPAGLAAQAFSKLEVASSAPGRGPTDQATGMLPKQSIRGGLRWTFTPVGSLNLVMLSSLTCQCPTALAVREAF